MLAHAALTIRSDCPRQLTKWPQYVQVTTTPSLAATTVTLVSGFPIFLLLVLPLDL